MGKEKNITKYFSITQETKELLVKKEVIKICKELKFILPKAVVVSVYKPGDDCYMPDSNAFRIVKKKKWGFEWLYNEKYLEVSSTWAEAKLFCTNIDVLNNDKKIIKIVEKGLESLSKTLVTGYRLEILL